MPEIDSKEVEGFKTVDALELMRWRSFCVYIGMGIWFYESDIKVEIAI